MSQRKCRKVNKVVDQSQDALNGVVSLEYQIDGMERSVNESSNKSY